MTITTKHHRWEPVVGIMNNSFTMYLKRINLVVKTRTRKETMGSVMDADYQGVLGRGDQESDIWTKF